MANNQNTDNLDYLEEDDDAATAKRCRHEARVGQRILCYLKKHAGWHLLRDVYHATRASEQYGAGMCLRVTDALIEGGEIEQEERDPHRYVRYSEEQS
jgi:hypothetical protein